MSKEHPIEGIIRRNKSPGFCPECYLFDPGFNEVEPWGHEPENCRNIRYCDFHGVEGHIPTHKCKRRCLHCKGWGQSMPYCRKLRDCHLCGKHGHNPLRCWWYSTISWMRKAKELNKCAECLRSFSKGEVECARCYTARSYWIPTSITKEGNQKEYQTEDNVDLVQRSQTELQEGKTIIETQSMQIKDLNGKY